MLFLLPVWRRDWSTLALVVLGTLVCLNYSRPLLGFRFKNLPLLKTFFAPTVVAASLLALPWLHEGPPRSGSAFTLVAFRSWLLLLFNMTLCDLRDLPGDRRAGTRSLPVCLGEKGTRLLLWSLLVVLEFLAVAAWRRAEPEWTQTWLLVAVGAPLYLGWLLLALRRARSERFYEWWVEGILFLPAIAVTLGRM